MIEARRLAKRFGAVQAVREVSFVAPDGRITGLLGPNGAGKSTSLRMVCTVMRPDTGAALIDGVDVAADPLAARRRIGVLSHAAGLYPHLTGRENVLYFGELHGMARAERERRADELIEMLDMQRLRHAPRQGFLAGPAPEDRAGPRAGARAAQRGARRADQRPRRDGGAQACVRAAGEAAGCRPLRAVLEPRDAGSGAALRRGRGDRARSRWSPPARPRRCASEPDRASFEDAFVKLTRPKAACLMRAILTVFRQGVDREPARPAHGAHRAAARPAVRPDLLLGDAAAFA
jgi:hypothetical protein